MAVDADELPGEDFSDPVYAAADSEKRISKHGRSVCEKSRPMDVELAIIIDGNGQPGRS
jgi:hypothetical protein